MKNVVKVPNTLSIYMNGVKVNELTVKEGILLYGVNAPYITLNYGKLVVCQEDIIISCDGTEYSYPGKALIESHMITISNH